MDVHTMSDRAILREMGYRVKRRRLEKNISQQRLASEAGLNRATVCEMEQGAAFGILTLIRILRVLDALDEIDNFLPERGFSPLQLAKMKGKRRWRASSRQKNSAEGGESTW